VGHQDRTGTQHVNHASFCHASEWLAYSLKGILQMQEDNPAVYQWCTVLRSVSIKNGGSQLLKHLESA